VFVVVKFQTIHMRSHYKYLIKISFKFQLQHFLLIIFKEIVTVSTLWSFKLLHWHPGHRSPTNQYLWHPGHRSPTNQYLWHPGHRSPTN